MFGLYRVVSSSTICLCGNFTSVVSSNFHLQRVHVLQPASAALNGGLLIRFFLERSTFVLTFCALECLPRLALSHFGNLCFTWPPFHSPRVVSLCPILPMHAWTHLSLTWLNLPWPWYSLSSRLHPACIQLSSLCLPPCILFALAILYFPFPHRMAPHLTFSYIHLALVAWFTCPLISSFHLVSFRSTWHHFQLPGTPVLSFTSPHFASQNKKLRCNRTIIELVF